MEVKINKNIVYLDIIISALLCFILFFLVIGYIIPKWIITIMLFVEFIFFLSSLITLSFISGSE